MNTIGEHSYKIPIVKNWGEDSKVIIGKYCSIADNVKIYIGGNHRTDWVSTFPFPKIKEFPDWKHIKDVSTSKGDVWIGNDVWIGDDVSILSGVKIGDGAVVGAKCTVSKDIEPYSVVVGNPQRVVKKRFTTEQINKLLAIKWWNWSDEDVNRNVHLLCSPNIDDFINNHILPNNK